MPIIVPHRGTRGTGMPTLPGPLMNVLQALFHLAYGLFGERMRIQGRPLVELETVGAKSGARRRTVLGSFPDPFIEPAPSAATAMNSTLVVASNAGSARNPAWLLNLAKHPDQVWLTQGRRRIKVAPETLEGAERERAWKHVTSLAPGYAGYEQKTDRAIPIVRLRAVREES